MDSAKISDFLFSFQLCLSLKDFVQIFTRECQGIMERTLRIYKVQSLNLDSPTYCFDDISIYSPFTELP